MIGGKGGRDEEKATGFISTLIPRGVASDVLGFLRLLLLGLLEHLLEELELGESLGGEECEEEERGKVRYGGEHSV